MSVKAPEESANLIFLFTVNLCSNSEDKLQIYRDNFEKAYLDSTERFYRTQAPSYLQQNGVQNYMKYVSDEGGLPEDIGSLNVNS